MPRKSGAIGALTTAHKTHTEYDLPVLSDLCDHHGISKLLKTGHGEWFNSVPGHHVFNPCIRPKRCSCSILFQKFRGRAGVCLNLTSPTSALGSSCPSGRPG